MEEIKIKAYDSFDLYAIYSEAKEPKGMVQIIHGMSEHKERYIPFFGVFVRDGGRVFLHLF